VTVQPIVVPTVPAGDGFVNARALDAQIQTLVGKINALIHALGVARQGDQLAPGSVRWRMFSEDCKRVVQAMARQLGDIRERLPDPTMLSSVPDVPPAGDPQYMVSSTVWLYGIDPKFPRIRGWEGILPGDPNRTYRLALRIRHYAEHTFVAIPTLDTSSPYFPNINGDKMAAGMVDACLGWGETPIGDKLMTPTPPGNVVFDNVDGIVWNHCKQPEIVGAYPTDFYKLTVGDQQWILNGWYGLQDIEAMYRPQRLDRVIDMIVRGGEVLRFVLDNLNGKSAFTFKTNYPADDDPRFPYVGRHRDAAAFQADIVAFEPVLPSPCWVTDDFGAPIIATPGGYLTSEDACIAYAFDVWRTGGISGTGIAYCAPVFVGRLLRPGDVITLTWEGNDPNYCSVEATVRLCNTSVIKRVKAVFDSNEVSMDVTYEEALAAYASGANIPDDFRPDPTWCPTFDTRADRAPCTP
jgi:hypothetical protein